MKILKIGASACAVYLLTTGPAWAPPGVPVPEIDGTGAFIAIGLLAGLVALVREKFFRN
jgi:hypothetical protein